MENNKHIIMGFLEQIRIANLSYIAGLSRYASLTDYAHLTRGEDGRTIWTEALQAALTENNVVMIPSSSEPYWLDGPVRMPSNRHIEAAPDAVIKLTENTKLIMLRNEQTQDGTHAPIDHDGRDVNISINGGRWEESNTHRAGYGKSGMYDDERSLYGVSTCMFFDHVENLTLTNMVFSHAAAFCVQLGDAKNVVIENIRFEDCYADGIHINGNVENVLVRDISGRVGDDLVALNMYDWQNSAVNFGPGKAIWCENIVAATGEGYKSMRLETGIYTYADGAQLDCSLSDVVIRNVQGVTTFKLYYQTPSYKLGSEPEKGDVGSMSNIYFDSIAVDLSAPVDDMDEYQNSDPVRGAFAAFEVGSNISDITLENIDLTLHREKYPLTYLMTIGPKSIRRGDIEIFDPYISCRVGNVTLNNITVNGEKLTDASDMVRIVSFDDINGDGRSSGAGHVEHIEVK